MLSRDQVLALMRERVHHPAGMRELLQVLEVPREERASFKRHIRSLVASGDLIQIRGQRFGLPEKMDLYVGRLQTHPAGYGFVTPERPLDAGGDIYISETISTKRCTATASSCASSGSRTAAAPKGASSACSSAPTRSIVGRYDRDDDGMGYVVPFDRRVLMDIFVPAGQEGGASPGEMVIVELTRWPTATRGAIGRVAEVLGDIDAPASTPRSSSASTAFPTRIRDEAIAEAVRLGSDGRRARHPRPHRFPRRADRHDRRRARARLRRCDHDREAAERPLLARRAHRRRVALRAGGQRARSRGLRARHVGVLSRSARCTCSRRNWRPDCAASIRTSTAWCSPASWRSTRRGEVVRSEFHDGVINSNERMTYTAVNGILTERDPELIARYEPLVPMFEPMRELFQILNAARHRRGSIDFDLNEAEIIMDSGGMVEAIVALERNIAHRLIEEFMLLANETVASHLESQAAPALYPDSRGAGPAEGGEVRRVRLGVRLQSRGRLTALRPRHFQRLIEKIQAGPKRNRLRS